MANPASGAPPKARRSERSDPATASAQPVSPRSSTDTSTTSESTSVTASSAGGGSSAEHRQTSSTGNGIAERLREQAKAKLGSQKDRALDGVGGVTNAIRQTTQSLRDKQHDTVARYVDQTMGQLDRITERLKEKDVGELIEDAQRMARRQPAMFVCGAFALGLIGARFLKSTPPDRRSQLPSVRPNRDSGTVWRPAEASTPYGSSASATSTRR